MNLVLARKWFTDTTTIGELFVVPEPISSEFSPWCAATRECFILEDATRPDGVKVQGATCIPLGRYEIQLTHSPKFKRTLPLLIQVPGFAGIRIHPGNDARDTEGCLLPGVERLPDFVAHSVVAFDALFAKLLDARKPIWLTIVKQAES